MEAAAESRCPNCFTAPLSTPCLRCGWASGLDNPPPALALGTLLDGRYRIGRVLGHGGFGITYLAWDENLHLRLAIKEYLPRDSATRAPDGVSLAVYSGPAAEQFAYGLERFLEEARALARFDQHPGIVTVKSFFRAHGTGYCVMDYVEGLTFKQYLAQQPDGRLPFEQALKLLMPVMDALRAVHQDGLLHRDITPDNIYLTRSGRVKLLDFGAARFAAGEHSRSLSVILKPGYAPEEQYRTRGQQGPWTDVYSLAATLYRAMTGQVPPEALDRLDADELLLPSQLGAVIRPEQEAVLVRALSVRAAGRFESVEALQNAWKKAAVIAPQPEDSGVSSSDTSPDTGQLSLEKSTKLEQRDGVHDDDSHSNSPQVARSKSMPVWAALASLGLFGSFVLAAWLLNVPDSFDAPHSSAEIDRPSQEIEQSSESLAADRPEDVRREESQSQFNEPAEIHRSQDSNSQTDAAPQDQNLIEQINSEIARNIEVWRADWGNGIYATVQTVPCELVEFASQGYIYDMSADIPLTRLKNASDAWSVNSNRAQTVKGCWFFKEGRLAHAKMKRKKDNKIWEQDLNFDDGSWIPELSIRRDTERPRYTSILERGSDLDQSAPQSWARYENARYGFSVEYPEQWAQGAESDNGDGLILFLGDPDIDIRVYAAQHRPDFSCFETIGQQSEIQRLTLNTGTIEDLYISKIDKDIKYCMRITDSKIDCYFYAKVPGKFFEENRLSLIYVAKSLSFKNSADYQN